MVSDTSRLRVYVSVPQNYVPSIELGTKAQITVPEYPGRKFSATVEASAQSVDVASGSTRILLVVDNANGELMTGAYANVSFELPHPEVAINVPASALIFNQNGLLVATVGWRQSRRAQAGHDLARSGQGRGNRIGHHRR